MIKLILLMALVSAPAMAIEKYPALTKEEQKDSNKVAARIAAITKKLTDRDPQISVDEIIELLRLERGL